MLCYTYIACLVLSNKTNPFHFAIFKTCLDFDQSAGSRRLGWGHRAKGRGVINSSLYSHMIKRQRLQYFDKRSCTKACHLAALLATAVTRGGTPSGPFRATAILSASGVSKRLPTTSVYTALSRSTFPPLQFIRPCLKAPSHHFSFTALSHR